MQKIILITLIGGMTFFSVIYAADTPTTSGGFRMAKTTRQESRPSGYCSDGDDLEQPPRGMLQQQSTGSDEISDVFQEPLDRHPSIPEEIVAAEDDADTLPEAGEEWSASISTSDFRVEEFLLQCFYVCRITSKKEQQALCEFFARIYWAEDCMITKETSKRLPNHNPMEHTQEVHMMMTLGNLDYGFEMDAGRYHSSFPCLKPITREKFIAMMRIAVPLKLTQSERLKIAEKDPQMMARYTEHFGFITQ